MIHYDHLSTYNPAGMAAQNAKTQAETDQISAQTELIKARTVQVTDL